MTAKSGWLNTRMNAFMCEVDFAEDADDARLRELDRFQLPLG